MQSEFSSCDENGNGVGVDEHANRIYQTEVARLQANQAFARGNTDEGWRIIREWEGALQALDQNGNAVQDPSEPTVTAEARIDSIATPTDGYGRLVTGSRTVSRYIQCGPLCLAGLADEEILGVLFDVTIATVVYSPVNTGEPVDATTKPKLGGPFEGDHRGHIIGAALGGQLDNGANLFSQNPRANQSAFKRMENHIRRTLTNNQEWTANITVVLSYNVPLWASMPDRYKFRPTRAYYRVVFRDSAGNFAGEKSALVSNR